MMQGMIQMEILRIIKGKLPRDKAKIHYPMEGGKYYETGKKVDSKFRKFFSVIFVNKPISKKAIGSFEKGLNAWKSFFR
jgi:hypothetical protein